MEKIFCKKTAYTAPSDLLELSQILKEVSIKTNVPEEILKGKGRKRKEADARKIYCRRSKELTPFSLNNIGALINRDKTTVLFSIREAKRVKEVNNLYKELFC